jgi:hypothetical protein
MVGGAASSKNRESEVAGDADQVSLKLLVQRSRNQIVAFLGAENAVYEIGSVCV